MFVPCVTSKFTAIGVPLRRVSRVTQSLSACSTSIAPTWGSPPGIEFECEPALHLAEPGTNRTAHRQTTSDVRVAVDLDFEAFDAHAEPIGDHSHRAVHAGRQRRAEQMSRIGEVVASGLDVVPHEPAASGSVGGSKPVDNRMPLNASIVIAIIAGALVTGMVLFAHGVF